MGKNKERKGTWAKVETYDDLQRTNYIGMRVHLITIIVFQVPAILNLMNVRTTSVILFTIISTLVGLFSPAAEFFFYKKDPHTPMVKHFVGYGFAVYYTIVIFGSDLSTIFLSVIPMLIVIMIYNDVKYTIKINIGVLVEMLVKTILMFTTHRFGYTDPESIFIQDVAMLLIAIFSVWTARTIDINEKQKLQKIHAMMNATESGIESIYMDISTLVDSAKGTAEAMDQVTIGTSDTAEAVSMQLQQTAVIRSGTNDVEMATEQMSNCIKEMVSCVESGSHDMSVLMQHVDSSVQTSVEVKEKLVTLEERLSEMNTVAKLISDIAFQTNLLALNANVEAARAGEAGKGFAVVADEVSNMSNRTAKATDQIVELIDGVSKALVNVTTAIEQMLTEIDEERDCAEKTESGFRVIEQNAGEMTGNVEALLNNLERLTNANHEILDSVEKISAVSQEVSALAESAQQQEGQNSLVLSQITEKMQELVENARS